MAYSSFKIIFSESDLATGAFPPLGTIVSILESSTVTNFKETLVASRTIAGEFTSPIFSGGIYNTYLGRTLADAFIADFNQTGKYQITAVDFSGVFSGLGRGSCTVTALYPNAVFAIDPAHPLPTNIRVEITNVISAPIIQFDAPTFSQASSQPCELIKITVVTNPISFKVVSPYVNNSPSNPLVFDINRGQTVQLVVENSDGVQSQLPIKLPDYLYPANFTAQIITTPSGSTVTIIGVKYEGLTLQYSLNGSTWQGSNIFAGLTAGLYNFYVRDQYGCSFLKPFEVKEFSNNDINIPVPNFSISKSNPIRYAQRVDFALNLKTDDNTLSYEAETNTVYCEVQNYLNTDQVTTQFKSNFATNEVNVIKRDGTKTAIFPVKKSYNMDIKDKRDARMTHVGSDFTKTGIYFTAGNVYNYDTNAVIGSYALNGALPEWGVIGNYFQIAGIWYVIEQIGYDSLKQASYLVITLTYTGNPNPIVVSTIYDRHNYEVFEFVTDFSNFANQEVQIETIASDVNYQTVRYLSEKIGTSEELDRYLEIRYWNTQNTDIFYATGFKGLVRMAYEMIKGKIDDQNEIHKTDTSVLLLNETMYETDDFGFEPQTKEVMRKLTRILSHEMVFINNVGYLKNGAFTVENIGFSNLYNITAPMIKTGSIFNAIVSNEDELIDFPPIDVPALIETENGFIKYK
jgi:hypothetical protein